MRRRQAGEEEVSGGREASYSKYGGREMRNKKVGGRKKGEKGGEKAISTEEALLKSSRLKIFEVMGGLV